MTSLAEQFLCNQKIIGNTSPASKNSLSENHTCMYIGPVMYFFSYLFMQAFKKLDSSKSGRVSVTDIRKYFNSKFRPPPQAGMMTYIFTTLLFEWIVTKFLNDDNIFIFLIKVSSFSIFSLYIWHCYKTLKLLFTYVDKPYKESFLSTFPCTAGVVPGVNPVQAFLEAVTASSRQDSVSYVEFEEYYEGLSLAIEDDVDFINILHNTWNI